MSINIEIRPKYVEDIISILVDEKLDIVAFRSSIQSLQDCDILTKDGASEEPQGHKFGNHS